MTSTDLFPAHLTAAQRFFYKHAGYSYHPDRETQEEGKQRTAQALAAAEAWASEQGYSFEWREDDHDSSDWSDEPDPWPQFVCIMRDPAGQIVDTLGGVDFGRQADPYAHPHRREVEAQLAAGIRPLPVDLSA